MAAGSTMLNMFGLTRDSSDVQQMLSVQLDLTSHSPDEVGCTTCRRPLMKVGNTGCCRRTFDGTCSARRAVL